MYLDSRDLIEERDNLKTAIFDSFIESFPQYEEMTESFEDIRFEEEEIESWKDYFLDDLQSIKEINKLEDEICNGEWDYGVTLIEEYYFEEYCEDFVESCGFISKDTPSLIRNNIDWEGIADDMRQDYSEVVFRGKTYLYR
jgi:hypothetical protein